jgi:hypothetical protein
MGSIVGAQVESVEKSVYLMHCITLLDWIMCLYHEAQHDCMINKHVE